MTAAARLVARSRLRLSRAPVAELAAAAIRAQEATGLEPADVEFIVVAVPAGAGADARVALERHAGELEPPVRGAA
jgi:hypothetical protein